MRKYALLTRSDCIEHAELMTVELFFVQWFSKKSLRLLKDLET